MTVFLAVIAPSWNLQLVNDANSGLTLMSSLRMTSPRLLRATRLCFLAGIMTAVIVNSCKGVLTIIHIPFLYVVLLMAIIVSHHFK